jgi:hypothetical protein
LYPTAYFFAIAAIGIQYSNSWRQVASSSLVIRLMAGSEVRGDEPTLTERLIRQLEAEQNLNSAAHRETA